MNVITQLFTIVRGGARQTAEAVVDARSLQLLEQQIRECEDVIQKSKRDLTRVVAERIAVERRVAAAGETIAEKEALARRAMADGEDALAHDVATTVGGHCRQRDLDRDGLEKLQAHERELGAMLRDAVSQIRDHRREMALLRATDHAQRAAVRLDTRGRRLDVRLDDIAGTTERIRHSQQALADRIEATRAVSEAVEGDPLDRQLREAGLVRDAYSAEAVLGRLKEDTVE